MTPRDIVCTALDGHAPPYVPWHFEFTNDALAKLRGRYGDDLTAILHNHIADYGVNRMTDIGDACVRDMFGVVWDRSKDEDIGVVKGCMLPEPTLAGFSFPDARLQMAGLGAWTAECSHLFRTFNLGFSLYERAWTLRGMEQLMIDMYEAPDFVHELLDAIADWNIALVREAMRTDIDAVRFGDDWGGQTGLQMGPDLWRTFIRPRVQRMYAAVKEGGKRVMIHSCGDVDELFDDLIDLGLDCFNPFQPEVMDVAALMGTYRGRLSFHGGLSTQRTLPYGSVDDVRQETRRLLDLGRQGNYIFAPAHAVEGDVPLV